ncbi:glycosyltransferase family 4 protein [Hartmannibacter diazotrophicus]|nr:glycosyltransferase family 4 protein [Hartmannibacter diazotrophicus]
MRSGPRIHCLLHPKERFSASGAGAFALNIVQTVRVSRYREAITVFGIPTDKPFEGVAFQPVRMNRWHRLFGRNMGFARAYLDAVRKAPPDMIEVFNRPLIALWLARKLRQVPVTVYIGNDPFTVKGAREAGERRRLMASLNRVYCVSEFVRGRFIEGLDAADAARVFVIHSGMPHEGDFPAKKAKEVVFVGRVVPEKGVLEFTEALAEVLPRHPDWSATLIGASWFEGTSELSDFEKAVAKAASSCDRIHAIGFRPNEEVMQHLARAAISAVPSNCEDAFPRTAVEALSAGCALIASRRGGLAEIGEHRARFVDAVTKDDLAAALEDLIGDDEKREALRRRAWNDFPFTLEAVTKTWDDLRADILRAR